MKHKQEVWKVFLILCRRKVICVTHNGRVSFQAESQSHDVMSRLVSVLQASVIMSNLSFGISLIGFFLQNES